MKKYKKIITLLTAGSMVAALALVVVLVMQKEVQVRATVKREERQN